jgi:hypothetical protein
MTVLLRFEVTSSAVNRLDVQSIAEHARLVKPSNRSSLKDNTPKRRHPWEENDAARQVELKDIVSV